jgi:hypothetical protein
VRQDVELPGPPALAEALLQQTLYNIVQNIVQNMIKLPFRFRYTTKGAIR